MEYDYEKFLEDSGEDCNSKRSFIEKANAEIKMVLEHNEGDTFLARKSYLMRLENAKFCALYGIYKEKDEYNSATSNLLDRLS